MYTKSTNKESNSSTLNSTTIRINFSTKEKIENLDFVRKHTFDEILNELMDFYKENKTNYKQTIKDFKDESGSTTIRISKDTKEKIENLDFVRKHTFDEILNELMDFYDKNKKEVKK